MRKADGSRSGSAPFRRRFSSSFPDGRTALLGSLIWALLAASSVALSLWLGGRQTAQSYLAPCLIFAVSAACAFVPALILAGWISAGRGREAAFAAMFVCLAALTIAATAFGYAAHYRIYYAQWHADAFTVEWLYQLVFTGLASLVQFAVLGLRHYLPVGLPALFVVSYWFSRFR